MTDSPNAGPTDPLGMTLSGFTEAVRSLGFGPGHAERAYQEVFRQGRTEALAMRGRVIARARVAPIVREQSEEVSEGTTVKFLQEVGPVGTGGLPSGWSGPRAPVGGGPLTTESVIIPMLGRSGRLTHTLCVSSQVGCAMGCGFCETAQMGLVRSLSAEEIVGQWWAATHVKRTRIDNIVFMGMGEPLDNLDEVLRAIAALTDHAGAAVPMSAVTVSTVGRVDGLRRLADVVRRDGWRRLGIAVSVNAPNDAVRDDLMPINRRWPMAELREALLDFRRGSHRKICFEYVLIPGVNDRREHARELAGYLDPFKGPLPGGTGKSPTGLVNVIPYNPRRESPWPAPDEADVTRFIDWLIEDGLFVKRRRTKGRSMMGACGQLGAAEIRRRKYVAMTVDRADA